MSRIETVMEGVLAQLTDGIFTSSTQLVGYRHHDATFQPSDLPLVQAFNPVVGGEEEAYQHSTEELEFQLEILDAASAGRNDVLRKVLETLAFEMHKDDTYAQSLGAERILIDVHDTFERAPIEISVAGCLVRVVFAELAVPSGADSGEVDVLALAGNASFATAVKDVVTNSLVIPGGLGTQRIETGGQSKLLLGGFPEFPLDLTVTKTLRFLWYARVNSPRDVDDGVTQVRFRILTSAGSFEPIVLEGTLGWTEFALDVEGGGAIADMSDVTDIEINRVIDDPNKTDTDESWILKRIYYKQSDTVAAITPTDESRTQDAMQAVLDHFADVVLAGTAIKLRGYLQPQHVTEALPFVMAYGGQTSMDEGPYEDRPASLVFNLDMIDALGRADEMRASFHTLASDLQDDPTLAGLARRVRVSARQVLERGSGETTQGRCEITVEWNDTTAGFKGTDVLALAGNADLCDDVGGTDTITDSAIIAGGIAWAKGTFRAFSFLRMINFPEFPLDLSASVTNRLRVLLYVRQNMARDPSPLGMRAMAINLFDSSGNQNNYSGDPNNARIDVTTGWTLFNCDLANPFATTGGGADLSDIVDIRVFMIADNNFVNHTDEALILKRIWFTDRDTGSVSDGRPL